MNFSNLPTSASVDVSCLLRLFENTTNSYKYLFFLALLDAIQCQNFAPGNLIALPELTMEMLVLAWYPHVYFKLSFGKQDTVTRELEKLSPQMVSAKFNPWDRVAIGKAISSTLQPPQELSRYVPFRLIRPFFPDLKPLNDHQVNGMVKEASQLYFSSLKPLYKLDATGSFIDVHPDWLKYLQQNFVIVRDWARWNYLNYMQTNNPLVPSLATKLFPPAERESLGAQTKYWKSYLAQNQVRCIYSNELLDLDKIALDHFIPWSFIVHNDLWNLIPVSSSANRAKSDRLPAVQYIQPFIELHYTALQHAEQALTQRQSAEVRSQYQHWLKLPPAEQPVNLEEFGNAFSEVLNHHLMLAHANGFQQNWIYEK